MALFGELSLDGRLRQVTLSVALGAGRGRIVRQLFTESAVLGVLGGVLGVLVARVGLRVIVALEPGNVPRMGGVEVDGGVLAFAIAVSLLAGVAAGLLPSMRMFSSNIGNALRERGSKTSGGRSGRRLQAWLVGSETALSLVLLVGAGLLIRSLAEVQSVDSGFDPEGRVTYEVPLPASYEFEEAIAFRADFLSRVRSCICCQRTARRWWKHGHGRSTTRGDAGELRRELFGQLARDQRRLLP